MRISDVCGQGGGSVAFARNREFLEVSGIMGGMSLMSRTHSATVVYSHERELFYHQTILPYRASMFVFPNPLTKLSLPIIHAHIPSTRFSYGKKIATSCYTFLISAKVGPRVPFFNRNTFGCFWSSPSSGTKYLINIIDEWKSCGA